MGLVSDAISSAEISTESESIGDVIAWTGWSIMYLGMFVTGIGYLRTKLFPQWLSGLLAVAAFAFFAFIAILNGEQLANNDIYHQKNKQKNKINYMVDIFNKNIHHNFSLGFCFNE